MKRKLLSTLLCLLLAGGMLAGCNGGAEPESPSADAPASETPAAESADTEAPSETAANGDVVDLELWHYFSGADATAFDAFVNQYNAENTKGIHVTSTFVSREDLLKQYTMGAMSGELPNIGMMDNPEMPAYITMGVYQDITPQVEAWGQIDNFYEGPLKTVMMDGKYYGLPQNSNCIGLFYNTKMLADAGVESPTTWDELEAACAALTTADTYGLAYSAVKNEEGTFQFIPWFLSAGGTLEDLSSAECVRSLEYLTGLLNKGYMSKDILNWTQNDLVSQFVGGKTAMMVNGPWVLPTIYEQAPDLEFEIIYIPKDKEFSSCLGGENFGICLEENLDESFDFLAYMMDAEHIADLCEGSGKLPPRSDAMALKDIWTNDKHLSMFGKIMEVAMPRGPHPKWPEISDAMITAVHESYTGAKDPQTALTEAAAKVAEIL